MRCIPQLARDRDFVGWLLRDGHLPKCLVRFTPEALESTTEVFEGRTCAQFALRPEPSLLCGSPCPPATRSDSRSLKSPSHSPDADEELGSWVGAFLWYCSWNNRITCRNTPHQQYHLYPYRQTLPPQAPPLPGGIRDRDKGQPTLCAPVRPEGYCNSKRLGEVTRTRQNTCLREHIAHAHRLSDPRRFAVLRFAALDKTLGTGKREEGKGMVCLANDRDVLRRAAQRHAVERRVTQHRGAHMHHKCVRSASSFSQVAVGRCRVCWCASHLARGACSLSDAQQQRRTRSTATGGCAPSPSLPPRVHPLNPTLGQRKLRVIELAGPWHSLVQFAVSCTVSQDTETVCLLSNLFVIRRRRIRHDARRA